MLIIYNRAGSGQLLEGFRGTNCSVLIYVGYAATVENNFCFCIQYVFM